jgi:hypothetical protein
MRRASISAAVAATLLVSSVHAQEGAARAGTDPTEESVKKVRELRKERIETLEKMIDQLAAQFRAQRVPYDDVLDGQRLLIEARLDAAETDEERVKVHEALVAVLKVRERYAEEQVKAAHETVANVLKARARRLEAEIHLEQAKMKLAKPGK